MFYLVVIVVALLDNGSASTPQKQQLRCNETFPEVHSGTCYEKCHANFIANGSICWGVCPPNTTDKDNICMKHSYETSSAGVAASHCFEHEERTGNLCYRKCKSGYKGVGSSCWEHCTQGYVDKSIFCSNEKSRYAKKSYGRGHGHALSCKPDQYERNRLCYERCRHGYEAVGSKCWSLCTGETVDLATDMCKKNNYTRVGIELYTNKMGVNGESASLKKSPNATGEVVGAVNITDGGDKSYAQPFSSFTPIVYIFALMVFVLG